MPSPTSRGEPTEPRIEPETKGRLKALCEVQKFPFQWNEDNAYTLSHTNLRPIHLKSGLTFGTVNCGLLLSLRLEYLFRDGEYFANLSNLAYQIVSK